MKLLLWTIVVLSLSLPACKKSDFVGDQDIGGGDAVSIDIGVSEIKANKHVHKGCICKHSHEFEEKKHSHNKW